MKTFLLLATLLISTQALAISELNYAQDMANIVMPFFATGTPGTVPGKGGVPIAYVKFENPQEIGAIVIVNGHGENNLFYAEAAYDLTQLGYSVYIFDHRGQGFSGRMLANSQISHVENFDDYVDDMKTFVDTVVNAVPHAKRYVFSFSMGGTIATLYGLKYPDDFNAYSLASPMYGFPTTPYPNWVAHMVVDLEVLIGHGSYWAKFQGPYDPSETFQDNGATSSEARWNFEYQMTNSHPVVQLGGPSNRWIQQALDSSSSALHNAHKFQPPAIIFRAGDDLVVTASNENKFCSKARHCQMGATYPDGLHSLVHERDEIRSDLYQRALKFFAEN